ncbi:MAG: hypothetical protein PHE55_20785 [Methylococcaceae bacterium]|nr:hypothetical protein [Methylococcaceae bacterium]
MKLMSCSVSADHRRYQMEELEAARLDAIRERAIADRSDQLMQTDCCPWSQDNFLEAWGEIDIVGPHRDTIAALCQAINRDDFDKIGAIVAIRINAYWRDQAMQQAARELRINGLGAA